MSIILVSPTEHDHYTDSVENVLNDKRGRKLFRNFMKDCWLQDDKKIEIWELANELYDRKESPSGSPKKYNKIVKKLLSEAEQIDNFDVNILRDLDKLAKKPESNKTEVNKVLEMLIWECARVLDPKYQRFKERLVASNVRFSTT